MAGSPIKTTFSKKAKKVATDTHRRANHLELELVLLGVKAAAPISYLIRLVCKLHNRQIFMHERFRR
jgi:hypothetical protein